jgi:hypothetical protein
MLAIEGAIVTIDAMGTQKAIAAKIIRKDADYVLALKENQGALCADVEEFFADPALAKACAEHRETDAGHGRIEERCARAADAGWLAGRHPALNMLRREQTAIPVKRKRVKAAINPDFRTALLRC